MVKVMQDPAVDKTLLSVASYQYIQKHRKNVESRKKLLSIILSQQRQLSRRANSHHANNHHAASAEKACTEKALAERELSEKTCTEKTCTEEASNNEQTNTGSTSTKKHQLNASKEHNNAISNTTSDFPICSNAKENLKTIQEISDMIMERKQMAAHCYLRACHMRLMRDVKNQAQ